MRNGRGILSIIKKSKSFCILFITSSILSGGMTNPVLSTKEIIVVPDVDLSKYLGTWSIYSKFLLMDFKQDSQNR